MSPKPAPKKEQESGSGSQNADLATTSTGGATLLIALQVGSRALTFIVNQILLRFLSPSILGISTQLEVYSISVLFFARESLRVAIQRQSDVSEVPDADALSDENEKAKPKQKSSSKKRGLKEKQKQKVAEKKEDKPLGISAETPAGKAQAIVNLSYLSIYAGIGFAILLGMLYLRATTSDISIQETPFFDAALKIYGVSAILELLSEPCFVVVQHKSMYKIRARAEAVATLLRCLACCGTSIWASQSNLDLGVLPFAIGQAVYSVMLTLVYYASTSSLAKASGFSLSLTPLYTSNPANIIILTLWPDTLLHLAWNFFTQSILKHLLTQGDTLLISLFSSPTAQGTYALANNYGGLLARLLLQPIEESSRSYFGRLLSSTSPSDPSSPQSTPPKEKVIAAKQSLNTLLRGYTLLSITAVTLGPVLAPQLLHLILGTHWSHTGAGAVLSVYCYYIPLLSLNGITEAFVSAVATEGEVNTQSGFFIVFSCAFAASSYLFLKVLGMGGEGLVWANCINMALRIGWSSVFIKRFMERGGVQWDLRGLLPGGGAVAGGVVTWGVLYQVSGTFTGGVMDLVKSGGVAVVFVGSL
ncbi:hypothetical protein HYALB_00012626 [Hymenoscyphus albidus]|uniref:Man(5)GlcNAc(2)-PP-dolichol translocation protein RFT1 n=1 Tax=Hymenoscyphus albidus TaxID=595503 RepID=A0A9N9Q608_9HELO|nr:hypothetical protein HYALB_00012626 [Hymenoscyphus albidus]